ncbi:MAG: alpha/beta fold hydrolase [Myxococcales bacterium]|nr:alpha/beta fold hydrolase [Myxococcales bacterium]
MTGRSRTPRGPAPKAALPARFDPFEAGFSVGQEIYKAGLLSAINGRRLTLGKPPVGWPAVGTTPSDVMWSEGGARLLRYRAPTARGATAKKPPLLLVCSLINRPYVLDLLPERSVVLRLLGDGIDVWLLDWGGTRREDAALDLADYALGRLPHAAEVVLKTTGQKQLHVLGYCMGGTFALMAIAAGCLPAASLVAMATPVDFHDPGLLSTWCRSPGFDGAALAKSYGNVPAHVLQPAFKMLDPIGIATKLIHLDEKVGDDDFLRFFLAMETWLEDSMAFPGGAFAQWVAAYRDNSLARGTLILAGKAIDLARVRCPILALVAKKDYITPPASSLALQDLAGTKDYEVIAIEGGHIGLSTGRAAHEHLWPRVSAWLKERDRAPAQQRKKP